MLWMGVAFDFADRVVAIGLHDAVGTRFEGVRAQHLFLVRKMTFDVFAIKDRILQHGVFACACRGCTGEHGCNTEKFGLHTAIPQIGVTPCRASVSPAPLNQRLRRSQTGNAFMVNAA